MPLGGIDNNGAPLRDILNLEPAGGNLLEKTYSELYKRTLQYQERMRSALIDENDSRLLAVPQNRLDGHKNSVIEQLRTVARIIASRQNLGVRRQVFFISLGGFDTHSGQKNTQNKLLAQIDQTLAHFARQMRVLGVEDQVTLFTASDFGRSMLTNGSGSDHGWGSHHFVVGGAGAGAGHNEKRNARTCQQGQAKLDNDINRRRHDAHREKPAGTLHPPVTDHTGKRTFARANAGPDTRPEDGPD